MDNMVERVARAIDDLPFRSWQALYDFCLPQDGEEAARRYAEATHRKSIDAVMLQARAAIGAMASPTEAMNDAAKPFRKGVGETAGRIWTAMIDASLTHPHPPLQE